MILRIWENIPTTPIELHVLSAGVSEEDHKFYTEGDDETAEQILQRKKGLGTTQRINYLIFHSKNSLHTKVITTNFPHFKNYRIGTLEQ